MAIVLNRADGAGGQVDQPFNTPNRKLGAAPNGSTVPLYAGELVMDTTTGIMYKAMDMTNTGWVVTQTKNI